MVFEAPYAHPRQNHEAVLPNVPTEEKATRRQNHFWICRRVATECRIASADLGTRDLHRLRRIGGADAGFGRLGIEGSMTEGVEPVPERVRSREPSRGSPREQRRRE